MSIKILNENNEVENNTDTSLEILKNLEKSFYRANPNSRKRNTLKSLEWFRKFVPKNFSKVRTARMFRDRDLWVDRIVPGNMYTFSYDAKHKDTLPVWDAQPLVFFFNTFRSKQGHEMLMGINLHYLPPALRLVAFKALLTLRNEKRYRKSTKLKLSWELLTGLSQSKYFEHSVKMYRVDHIRSKFVKIPARSWELALFLPIQRFVKGTTKDAYKLIK